MLMESSGGETMAMVSKLIYLIMITTLALIYTKLRISF